VKVEDVGYIKRELTANIIETDDLSFLCGRKTLEEWNAKLDFKARRLEFVDKGKSTKLEMSEGGHLLMNLEKVGEWTNGEYYLFNRDR
jgi:hypothetical protein